MSRLLALAAVVLLPASGALAAEPVGLITELHQQSGRVDVKRADGADWETPRPLLSLGAGDQVRVSGGARAVLVFTASQRSAVVTQANSPFVVEEPRQPGLGERVRSALSFLQATPRDRGRRALAVRSPRAGGGLTSVVLITPRDTLVSADGLALEWSGSQTTRYTARVVGPDRRVVWERQSLAMTPLPVTPGEVHLVPGRYRWEVESAGQGVQSAPFEVATPEVSARARAMVEAVNAARYPPATAALLRASSLMRERFHADARRELLAAIAAHPDEPTLRLLLADVYARTGLDNLAASELDRAEALSARR